MSSHDIDNADDRTTDLLKRALAEEAAMVDPSPGGLQEIQRRTAQHESATRRSRRRWLLVTPLGAGLAAAAVIFGIVLVNGGSNSASNKPPAVSQPTEHQGAYDPTAPASDQFTMYYLGPVPEVGSDGKMRTARLYAETHTVTDPGDDARLAAVNELLTSTPIDPDYKAWLPAGIYATDITDDAGVTTVHLAGSLSLLSIGALPHHAPAGFSENEGVAIQGLLKTMGAAGPVAFTYNGESIDMLELNDVSPSISPAADDAVRAFVTIDNIVDGQTVSSPVTAQISGNTFEGNVVWQLFDDSGAKIDEGVITTSQGMWTQVPVELGDLAPGAYTFKALEYSAEDGSPINVDDKTFTVE